MNPSEIAPTKTNLFDFKGQLIFSVDGHTLLEEKREVLVLHLMDVISKMKNERKILNKLLEESYTLLDVVKVGIGEFELQKIVNGSKSISELNIHEKGVMGVNIPAIKYKEDVKIWPVNSFNNTNMDYDRLLYNIREILKQIVFVAQVEASAWRLAHEIKKTQRKVNALENVFIPDFKEIIKFIQDTLEERERETFFQMKRVKNAQESS